uniref:Uncharacterized protein n=1 Tax=Glossina pallidipes TaxID=7398 RepID=A0A1A9ZJ25_GLOPL
MATILLFTVAHQNKHFSVVPFFLGVLHYSWLLYVNGKLSVLLTFGRMLSGMARKLMQCSMTRSSDYRYVDNEAIFISISSTLRRETYTNTYNDEPVKLAIPTLVRQLLYIKLIFWYHQVCTLNSI